MRLEDHVAVRQQHHRAGRRQPRQRVQCARIQALGERIVEQEGRHAQQPRVAAGLLAETLQRAEVIDIAQFGAQRFEDVPVTRAAFGAELVFQPRAQVVLDTVVVEQRVVAIDQEHDAVLARLFVPLAHGRLLIRRRLGALLGVAAEALAHRRQHLVRIVGVAARAETGEQRRAQYRRGHALVDGGVDGPAALAGIGDAAGESVQGRILAQRGGRQIEQPGTDDATAPPQFRDLRQIEVVLVELGLAQGRRLGVSGGGFLLADIGAVQYRQPFRVGAHDAVLDAVVDHLDEVAGAVRAAVQIALVGAVASMVGSAPARRRLGRLGARRQRREQRRDMRHGVFFAAYHQAVAALETSHAAAGADVDVMQAAFFELLGAADVVAVVGVAAIDDDVAFLQQWRQRRQRGIDHAGRHHHPDDTWLDQFPHQLFLRRYPRHRRRGDGLQGLAVRVEGDAFVTTRRQAAYHVGAHAAQTYHPKLHMSLLVLRGAATASRRWHELARGGRQDKPACAWRRGWSVRKRTQIFGQAHRSQRWTGALIRHMLPEYTQRWRETMGFVLVLIAVVILIAGLRVANQYQRAVVFRLGKLQALRGPGLYWLIPVLEWQRTVDLRTITSSVDQQETITKDNVPVKVTVVIWYAITDPIKSVVDVSRAVVQVALTSLRNVIGRHTLDDVLKEQERLGTDMRKVIDSATEPWGVKVTRVEMRNVEIPESMQRAMAQEAEALREKRARIIKAEAELEAALKLREAAGLIMENPAGLELRRMQMITEVGAEQNTTTIIMMPSEFVSMAKGIADWTGRLGGKAGDQAAK